MCKGLVIIIEKLSQNKTIYSPKAFPCGRTGKWEVYLVRWVDMDRRCLLIPPAPAEQKEVLIIFVWYQAVVWVWTYLLRKIHSLRYSTLESSKGKENSILNWPVRTLRTHSVRTPWESAWFLTSWMLGLCFHFVSLEACKNLLEKGCGHQPSSEELQVVLTPVSSPHIGDSGPQMWDWDED